jgi:hypothetical protein
LEREGDENAVRPVGCEAWGFKSAAQKPEPKLALAIL